MDPGMRTSLRELVLVIGLLNMSRAGKGCLGHQELLPLALCIDLSLIIGVSW
jgi:hypothetical protein